MEQQQTKIETFDIEQPIKQYKQNSKSFGDLTVIFIFETLCTGLFSYGIVCSQGSDIMISCYFFAALFISCRFTGGHVNPAVSFSFYCDDTINSWTLRVYWLAQFCGAIGGAWIAYLILGELGSPSIQILTLEWMLADLVAEATGTCLFVLFIHIQCHENTRLTDNDVAGLGLMALALLFARVFTFHSGGVVNPAMGVGLELFHAFWDNDTSRLNNFWVYLFSPLLGGYVAQLFYNSVYVPLRV